MSIETEQKLKSKILTHGLSISKQGIRIADKPAYNFEAQPKFLTLDDQVKLVLSTKLKDSFLLYNHIGSFNIDSEYNAWMPDIDDLLSNKSNKLHVYLGILCPRAEINFENRKIKPLENLNDAIKEYFNRWEEYIKLHDFGTSNNAIIMRDEYDFDTSFLTSINNDKIAKDDLKKWVSSCLESKIDSWQAISWKGLYPLYKIFDESLQKKIKFILEIDDQTKTKEKVLMMGVIPIEDSIYYYRIKFPVYLNIKFVTQNGESINTTIRKFSDLQITWIMIGIPSEIGFFSINTRNIPILALGSHSFKSNEEHKFTLQASEDLPATSVICVSILHQTSFYGMKFAIKDSNYNEIDITINRNKKETMENYNGDEEDFSSEEEDENKISEDIHFHEYLLQWCFLPKDQKIVEADIKLIPTKDIINLNVIGQMHQNIPSLHKKKAKNKKFDFKESISDDNILKQENFVAGIFTVILNHVKEFTHNISKISKLQKFTNAQAIKNRFDNIVLDFEQGVRDLNPEITIYNVEELNSIKETVQFVKSENILLINQVATMSLTLEKIEDMRKSNSYNINNVFKVPEIDSELFQNPFDGKNNDLRNKISRKIYISRRCLDVSKQQDNSEVIHWLAPDKMCDPKNPKEVLFQYDKKSEIF
ncbi:15731_t:CDS:2, partial [Dentiscutata erythropus]